jgi:hypothetical protein
MHSPVLFSLLARLPLFLVIIDSNWTRIRSGSPPFSLFLSSCSTYHIFGHHRLELDPGHEVVVHLSASSSLLALLTIFLATMDSTRSGSPPVSLFFSPCLTYHIFGHHRLELDPGHEMVVPLSASSSLLALLTIFLATMDSNWTLDTKW